MERRGDGGWEMGDEGTGEEGRGRREDGGGVGGSLGRTPWAGPPGLGPTWPRSVGG